MPVIFGGAVGAGIPTVAEGIKEKFPGIGIHPFQYPAGIVFQPVAAHAEGQATIVKAVFIVPTSTLYFES